MDKSVSFFVAVDPAIQIHRRPEVVALNARAVVLSPHHVLDELAQKLDAVIIVDHSVCVWLLIGAMSVFRNKDAGRVIALVDIHDG